MERIVLKNIVKSFGKRIVINDVNLTIHQGEIHALLGNNGSGKSTLIKIIAGLLKPDSGSIGIELERETRSISKKDIGFVFDQPIFLPYFSAYEYFEFTAKLRGLESYEQKIQELLLSFDLPEDKSLIKDYSSGMQQKVSVLSVLLPEYSFLILDEPFSNLDTSSIRKLCELLERLRSLNVGILITSHQFDVIFDIASHISFINKSGITLSASKKEIEKLTIEKFPSHEGAMAFEKFIESILI